MTKTKSRLKRPEIKALLREDEDFLQPLMRAALQEVLEAEMSQALGASKGERRAERLGYRSGYYSRNLVTRVGTLELRVPQDREGRFSTEVFARYQRSEKALVSALVEMYVQGVSTRKIKAVSEELCGHEFSASVVSELNKKLDEELARFAGRRLEEEYPYVILDARYERVREAGVVRSRAVLVAIGIDWQGRRRVIGVELANRESATSWKEFLLGLKTRGLGGVRLVVSDQHEGLKRAVGEVLSEAVWQRGGLNRGRGVDAEAGQDGGETCGNADVRERGQVKIAICVGFSPAAENPKTRAATHGADVRRFYVRTTRGENLGELIAALYRTDPETRASP